MCRWFDSGYHHSKAPFLGAFFRLRYWNLPRHVSYLRLFLLAEGAFVFESVAFSGSIPAITT